MNPYRETAERLAHWDQPQAGDLVRTVDTGAIGDVLETGACGAVLVYFDWTAEPMDASEVVVTERRSTLIGSAGE